MRQKTPLLLAALTFLLLAYHVHPMVTYQVYRKSSGTTETISVPGRVSLQATLNQGDWLRFPKNNEYLYLELIRVEDAQSAVVHAATPADSFYGTLRKFQPLILGSFKINPLSLNPLKQQISELIVLYYPATRPPTTPIPARPLYPARSRFSAPTSPRSGAPTASRIARNLSVNNEVLVFERLRVRLNRVNARNPRDTYDDTAELTISTPTARYYESIRPGRSVFIEGYEIYVEWIRPSARPGQGTIRIWFTQRSP